MCRAKCRTLDCFEGLFAMKDGRNPLSGHYMFEKKEGKDKCEKIC